MSHPTDAIEAIYNDRGRTLLIAREYAANTDPAVAAVWRAVS